MSKANLELFSFFYLKQIGGECQAIRIYFDRLGCSKQELQDGDCSGMPPDPANPTSTKHKKIPGAATMKNYDPDRPEKSLFWRIAPAKKDDHLPADEHVVDLKIWFMGESLGNPDFFENIDQKLIRNDPIDPTSNDYKILEQDQPITISLDSSKKYTLYWHPIYEKDGKKYLWNDVDRDKARENLKCIPEIQRYLLLTTTEREERQKAGTNFGCGINLFKYWSIAHSSGLDDKDVIEAKFNIDRSIDKHLSFNVFYEAIRFKPINTAIIYTVGPSNKGEKIMIDTFVTHIESTGYYGNTQRKQEARIDRQKNQLLGIFDYVIFSGGKLVKPRP